MRIGLNILFLRPGIVGGTETYAAGLLSGLSELGSPHEFFIFVSRDAKDWPLPEMSNFHRVVCDVSSKNRGMRYCFEQFVLPRLASTYRLDVLHSLGYVGPLRTHCKSIITIHDLNYVAFGNQMSQIRRLALGWFVKFGVLAADHLVTVSDFSRRQIERYLPHSVGKISVIHEAPHPARKNAQLLHLDELHRRFGLVSPYWVTFISDSPNKNIPNLLRAISIVRRDFGLMNMLVLIGQRPTSKTVNDVADIDGVKFTGRLDDTHVSSILSGAQILIFPSLYEGFGLPVVEAMELGVPVVCSRVSALPEVAGDAAAFFDPLSVENMANVIASVARDPELRSSLIARGIENTKRFSWYQTAEKTMGIYNKQCST